MSKIEDDLRKAFELAGTARGEQSPREGMLTKEVRITPASEAWGPEVDWHVVVRGGGSSGVVGSGDGFVRARTENEARQLAAEIFHCPIDVVTATRTDVPNTGFGD